MKSTIFWDMMRPLKVNRRFGRTYSLHLQGRGIGRVRNQCKSGWQAELGLLFYPEDGGDMLVRNVGWLSTDYTALYSKRHKSSNVMMDWLCNLSTNYGAVFRCCVFCALWHDEPLGSHTVLRTARIVTAYLKEALCGLWILSAYLLKAYGNIGVPNVTSKLSVYFTLFISYSFVFSNAKSLWSVLCLAADPTIFF
jgi:hypothetical protein